MTNQPIKPEDLGKLELVAAGELKLNKYGKFNLETINSYLNQHNLELEIRYFKNQDKYGFLIRKTPQELINIAKKFYDDRDIDFEDLILNSKSKPQDKSKDKK